MAVRIYSLAKELKLDSKELVELCTRAGIQDKGSALASLDDTEVARLKEFISGKSKSPERPTATTETTATPKAPAVMKREDYVALYALRLWSDSVQSVIFIAKSGS